MCAARRVLSSLACCASLCLSACGEAAAAPAESADSAAACAAVVSEFRGFALAHAACLTAEECAVVVTSTGAGECTGQDTFGANGLPFSAVRVDAASDANAFLTRWVASGCALQDDVTRVGDDVQNAGTAVCVEGTCGARSASCVDGGPI